MSEQIEAQLKQAAAAHAEAIQRTRELNSNLAKASHQATEASTLGAALLKDAADGADVTDDQLLAADAEARRLKAVQAISAAKHEAGLRQQHKAHWDLLAAQAGAVEGDYARAVDGLIEHGENVDECFAALEDALAGFYEQKKAVDLAIRAAHEHNMRLTEVAPGHPCPLAHTNPLIRDAHPGNLPKARVPIQPLFIAPKAELFENQAAGSINAKRVTIHALAPRMRSIFNRPVRSDKAA